MKANRPTTAATKRRLRTRSGTVIDGIGAVLHHLARGGDPCAPKSYIDADGIRIGAIIGSIRNRQRIGKLPAAVARRLERYRGWTWRALEQHFEDGFAQLRAYALRNCDSQVPEGYRTADGYHLAVFVSHLRRKHRKDGLPPAQVRRIESLPKWSWEPLIDQWNDCFTVLAAHLARGEATLGIPLSLTSGRGHSIRAWVSMQRSNCVVMRTKHPERHARLSALAGWEWQCDRWSPWYELLLAFAAKHGHTRVRQHEVVRGRRLGTWVGNQRALYAKGELRPDRVALLAAAPGWLWGASILNWQDSCDELAAYVDTHGHSAVPYEFTTRTKFRLGSWVSRVRKLLREGSLDPQRLAMLVRAVQHEHVMVPRSLRALM